MRRKIQKQLRDKKRDDFVVAVVVVVLRRRRRRMWSRHQLWGRGTNCGLISYLPTPPLRQDMTQGQFLSGV